MGLRLDGNVRIGDGRREQLAQRAQEEGDGGRDAALLLDGVLELLEQRVLQDGVDDQDQGGQDAGEQRLRALVLEHGQQRPDGAGRLGLLLAAAARQQRLVVLGLVLARGHARVEDPDGVRDDDGRRAGERAGHHALGRGQVLGEAAGLLEGGGLEGGARPLVPVVVHKVGHGDAEEGRVEARVQAAESLALDDVLDGLEEGRVGALGLDLGAGGEGDEGVAVWEVGVVAR